MNKFLENIMDKYEFETIHELIYTLLPRGYNVPMIISSYDDIKILPDKTKITTFGYVNKIEIKNFGRKLSIIKAIAIKNGQRIHLQWITSKQKANGMLFSLEQKIGPLELNNLIQISGKIKSFENNNGYIHKYIEQPTINQVKSEKTSDNEYIIPEPLYRLKPGVRPTQIQLVIRELLKDFKPSDDFLPKELEKRLNLQDMKTSLTYIHGLKSIPISKLVDFLEYDGFIRRINAEKIWDIVKLGQSKEEREKIDSFEYISEDVIKIIKDIQSKLKFNLTNDQKKAIWNTLNLFAKEKSSNTLIFGDVGSGKTMVALFISKVLYNLGKQVAIIAPTSLLSTQHYLEAKELFEGDNIFLITSKTKKKEKELINKKLSSGESVIVFGTSSANKLEYTNLDAVFIDEEQKFGVNDKSFLKNKYNCHSIFMTATPIPRTLAGAIYTNFNICKIEEKPAIQKSRITKVTQELSIEENKFIEDRVLNYGDQALVIVPAIVSNDMVSSSQAEIKYKKLFPSFKIGVINGRMKQDKIEKITEEFMSGNLDMLIATTMVDSGFSNKKLSFVFIENAERFGIAQMHQIRGRVGRAERQGYCYILTIKEINLLKEETKNRLLSLERSENGFELSLEDMKLRGNGDLKGNEQSGGDLNIIEWEQEIKIMIDFLRNS